MKISSHRLCPKCGTKKVTRHHLTYTCERCRIDFKGKKLSFGPFVLRIAFMPKEIRKKDIQPKDHLFYGALQIPVPSLPNRIREAADV